MDLDNDLVLETVFRKIGDKLGKPPVLVLDMLDIPRSTKAGMGFISGFAKAFSSVLQVVRERSLAEVTVCASSASAGGLNALELVDACQRYAADGEEALQAKKAEMEERACEDVETFLRDCKFKTVDDITPAGLKALLQNRAGGALLASWNAHAVIWRIREEKYQFASELHADIDLAVSESGATFARVVFGVLDEVDCADLLRCVNRKGFTPALLNIGNGRQRFEPDIRNGHRAIVDSKELSDYLLEVLRPHLPEVVDGGFLVDLNERCRVLCYTPGQEFGPHYDACFVRPRGSPNAGDASMITVQLYLHDVPDSAGGATTFLPGERGVGPKEPLLCQPKAGSVLLFTQNLLHEGSLVTSGLKYTLRTEAMYRPVC
ncbi:axeA1 [Symbiodinium pilosum]|uniref:AxeA1 protein n=1 Tax=Symbiodinium pilosum TaxID=2952 RepID=A0A812SWU3_SYMPI|nr:axeA1 [Symbiodinium pilosum]